MVDGYIHVHTAMCLWLRRGTYVATDEINNTFSQLWFSTLCQPIWPHMQKVAVNDELWIINCNMLTASHYHTILSMNTNQHYCFELRLKRMHFAITQSHIYMYSGTAMHVQCCSWLHWYFSNYLNYQIQSVITILYLLSLHSLLLVSMFWLAGVYSLRDHTCI